MAYIITIIAAFIFLLLSAFIANSIRFEGGSRPKDPQKRKMWFWILAVLNPIITFLVGYFVFMPKDAGRMATHEYLQALSIGTGVGFILYILLGFLLSKLFRTGKIGNWF